MTDNSARNINLNMRTTKQEKLFLQQASVLAGFSNLTNFVMTAARKEAIRILNDVNTTYLSSQDWEMVNKLIASPPQPNEHLKELLSDEE